MTRIRMHSLAGAIGVTVLLLLFPVLLPEIKIHLVTEVLIFALFAVSFNLLFGYAGLLPFGHAALFGIGAYGAALISRHFPGVPLLLTLLIAALFGFMIGALIGFFCVKLRGPSFALLSLAFQMFLFAVAMKWRSLTNGDDGMGVIRPDFYLPGFGSVSMGGIQNFYYLTLIIVAIGILACYLFLKTPFGNSVVCIREQNIRASFLGYDVFLTQLTVFSVSGIFAGLAGGLFVFFEKFANTSCLDINMSLSVVLMTVIGGSGYFLGPVLGAAFYIVLQDWISGLINYWLMVMGTIFVLIVLYLEGGLISLFINESIWRWFCRESK